MAMDVPAWMLDPVRMTHEIMVMIALAIGLTFIIAYRKRIMVALTGDDRLHIDCLDVIWWLVRCGGCCHGAWTVHVSNFLVSCCGCCCADSCKKIFKGQNLVTMMGRMLGITAHCMEMKNIICGDLPRVGRRDFYLKVECAALPEIVTSVAEEQLPKAVHFPEVLTLQLRNSHFEESVVITVCELQVLGSVDICWVELSAQDIYNWCWEENEQDRAIRFEMKPCSGLVWETSPWIFIEFSSSTDVREMGANVTHTEAPRIGHFAYNEEEQGTYEELDMAKFKHRYELLDPAGNPILEPNEDDLHKLVCLRWWLRCGVWLLTTLVFTAIFGYSLFRAYIFSCYDQLRWITIAYYSNLGKKDAFPISYFDLMKLVSRCHRTMEGTGIAHQLPCRPSDDEVDDFCVNPSRNSSLFPDAQPRPRAFHAWLEGLTGQDTFYGMPWGFECHAQACELEHSISPLDLTAFLVAVLLIIATILLHCGVDACVKHKRTQLQKEVSKTQRNHRRSQRPNRSQAGATFQAAAANSSTFGGGLGLF